jgi:UDP-N-acetylglucosamine:LPS N-acetylglucosamine transferase
LIEDGELSQETLRAALQKALFDIELREAMTENSAALGEREAAEKILAVADEAIARIRK